MSDPSGQNTRGAVKARRDAEAWQRGNAAKRKARRKRKAKEDRGREARAARARLSWWERLDLYLDDLEERAEEREKIVTIMIAVAAVAVLVIGAFVDLPWI